jgi:hypothetical protein
MKTRVLIPGPSSTANLSISDTTPLDISPHEFGQPRETKTRSLPRDSIFVVRQHRKDT